MVEIIGCLSPLELICIMTKHDDTFYLEGIKEHVAAIKGYLPSSKEAFLADIKTQDAVLMRLLALG